MTVGRGDFGDFASRTVALLTTSEFSERFPLSSG